MKDNPLVTVAISTCNRSERHIRESLESVLRQSYRELEIIVADDASTKVEVAAIVNSYGDARISYHRHERNVGVARNFDWCVRQARGEWVNVFHDDDVMLPDNVQNMVAEARRHPKVNFQFTEVIFIDDESVEMALPHWSVEIPKGVVYPGRYLVEFLFARFANKICAPSVFIKRDVYLRGLPFSPSPSFTTDLNMWLKVLNFPDVFFLVREDIGVKYRVHTQQAATTGVSKERRYVLLEFGRIFSSLRLGHKLSYLNRVVRMAAGYSGRRIKRVAGLGAATR